MLISERAKVLPGLKGEKILKIKFFIDVDTGRLEDIREYPDDVTKDEIENDLDEWLDGKIKFGWEENVESKE